MTRRLVNHILAGAAHVLRDPRAELVLERIYTDAQRAADDVQADPDVGDFGYAPRPSQGEFLYLICRASAARRIVGFPTSAGAMAIYCAAAVRDNGGDGVVISSDHRPGRIEAARNNLVDAGLDRLVELRHGDPLDALPDVAGPVDVAYLDGWPELGAPSRALRALELLRPVLRPGALVINDGQEPDYLDHVRAPDSGFRTSILDFGVLSVLD